MKKPSNPAGDANDFNRLIGLGSSSQVKSYYPDLIQKIDELRREKEKFHSIFYNAQEGIFRSNMQGEVTDMNPAMIRIFCQDNQKECKIGHFNIQRFLKDRLLWIKIINELNEEKAIVEKEALLVHPDGRESWVSLNLILKESGGEKVIEGILDDITEKKKNLDELRRTQSYLNNIINSMPSLLIGIDPNGSITSLNHEAERTSGIPLNHAIGKKIYDVFPDYQPYLTNIVNSPKKVVNHKKVLQTQTDGNHHMAITAFPLITNGLEGAVVRIDDITEVERQEEQLKQAQKMEVVGTLAGGIAHDFNNLLTGSLGAVSILKTLMTSNNLSKELLYKNLNIIESATARSATMVKQLLTLSKRQTAEYRIINLKSCITQVSDILQTALDKSIRVTVELPEKPVMVNADSSQLEQVLLNLCMNGSHAMTIMRDSSALWGGELKISVKKLVASTKKEKDNQLSYWQIDISDTGVGISKNLRGKISTPFFTTKEQGQGTGLGLSMAYKIIKEHKGYIEFTSIPGKGSSFYLMLPVSEEEESSQNISQDTITSFKGEKSILIIDDEDIVRDITTEILNACNYEVYSKSSGTDGLELYSKLHKSIDLVLLDVSMPGMGGDQVYPRLLEINPEAKILFISGNEQDARLKALRSTHSINFLPKPFSVEQLVSAISEVLK